MSTESQNNANRNNAKNSTGPRTAEGKARSSRNSTVHGLTGKCPILPGEDPADLLALAESYRADLKPNGRRRGRSGRTHGRRPIPPPSHRPHRGWLFRPAPALQRGARPHQPGRQSRPAGLGLSFRLQPEQVLEKLSRYEGRIQRDYFPLPERPANPASRPKKGNCRNEPEIQAKANPPNTFRRCRRSPARAVPTPPPPMMPRRMPKNKPTQYEVDIFNPSTNHASPLPKPKNPAPAPVA